MAHRSTKEVFEDHLATREKHQLGADVGRNYAEDCIIMTRRGSFHGHDGVRELGTRLQHELPNGHYRYKTVGVEGRVAFLIWDARAGETTVDDGAGSFQNRLSVLRCAHPCRTWMDMAARGPRGTRPARSPAHCTRRMR